MPIPEDDPKDAADAIRRAADLHRDGRLAEAEAAYGRILSAHPNEPQAWFGLGSVKTQNGDLHAAILHPEHAVALMGQRSELHHNLAAAKAGLGRFVFIDGMPRSGTTLVEQILSAHPNAHGAGELPAIDSITCNLGEHATGETQYPRSVRHVGPEAFRSFGGVYARCVGARAPDSQRITDKSPLNFRHAGLISVLLP